MKKQTNLKSIVLLSALLVNCGWLQAANPADINNNRAVDSTDLTIFVAAWLSDDTPTPNWNPACDISDPNDGFIDGSDFAVLYANWLLPAGIGFPCMVECDTQCYGNADCTLEGGALMGFYHVGNPDLFILTMALENADQMYDECADFNRDLKVDQDDVDILTTYYQVKEPPRGPGIPHDCPITP